MSSTDIRTGHWLYGFAVAHVQSYLLASPRLRDIQGGSQLLEDLCGKVFDEARQAAGLTDARILSQAASGARLESSDAGALARLHATWPLIADARAPGALIQQALIDVDAAGGLAAAQRKLSERLHASRAAPTCSLPAVGPLVARYGRTGEPVEREQFVGGERERIDRTTDAKVAAWRDLKEQASLDRRFLGPELAESYRFAAGRERDEESLASEDDPYVAVVHADGNAVGRFIDSLVATAGERDGAAEVFRRFSDALSQATREAANEAVREVLVRDFEATSKLEEQGRRKPNTNSGRLPILKARPIVLGGDDLTIILKARLAFDFTERFLEAFERTTRAQLACFGVPGFEGLTASAGLAITKEKFPFDRAYELAESLCIQAKRHAKRETDALSTLAFHRVTTSLPQDAATVLEHELTRGGRRLTFEAYRTGVRSAESVASFDALRRLAAALPNDQRGGFRGLLAQLRRSPDRAEEAFLRMCEVRRRRRASETTERLRAALCELNGEGRLLWRKDPESDLLRTPLLDAHVVALTHRAAGAGERR